MPKGIALIIAKKAMGDDSDKPKSEYAEMAADLIRYVQDEDKEGLADLLEALSMKRSEEDKDDEKDDDGG